MGILFQFGKNFSLDETLRKVDGAAAEIVYRASLPKSHPAYEYTEPTLKHDMADLLGKKVYRALVSEAKKQKGHKRKRAPSRAKRAGLMATAARSAPAAMRGSSAYLVFSGKTPKGNKSHKFWYGSAKGTKVYRAWGAMGSESFQEQIDTYYSAADAKAELSKSVASKKAARYKAKTKPSWLTAAERNYRG